MAERTWTVNLQMRLARRDLEDIQGVEHWLNGQLCDLQDVDEVVILGVRDDAPRLDRLGMLDALDKVLIYALPAEERDFVDSGKQGMHIVHEMRRLAVWLTDERAKDEPCLCGELGPHWICGVRSPEDQSALEAIANRVDAAQFRMADHIRFLHDVVLLMEMHSFTAWSAEKGFA